MQPHVGLPGLESSLLAHLWAGDWGEGEAVGLQRGRNGLLHAELQKGSSM